MDAVVDTSQRPLCRITVGTSPTIESFDDIFKQVEAELGRHRSICVLANAEKTARIDLAHVKRIAEFGQTHHTLLQAYMRALAFVIPSAVVRGALKLAFQIKTPPHPYRVCHSEEEAQAYLASFIDQISG
ncbi:STAS/SEC14 domain-containing protein [Enhygromyxa salina]|uniref:STAS/SEC14 domain-containing protein n=1 Tax=Enhygromyxa salina TaxID=215803 RepID=UPI000D0879F7|nr:STAS/SEC14 domain-containing protein [Enhygromyxa salina]